MRFQLCTRPPGNETDRDAGWQPVEVITTKSAKAMFEYGEAYMKDNGIDYRNAFFYKV